MNFFRGNPKKPVVDPYAPIPVGDCVETDWAAWEELVASIEPSDNKHSVGDLQTQPA